MKKWNSQKDKMQDKWVIETIFNYKKNGYFVDLAATDGIEINNTLLLEQHLGWKGICIEPNTNFYEQLKKNRKCHVTNMVIDKENDLDIEFRIDNGMLGGIVSEDTDNSYRIRSAQLKTATILKLKTKTLDFILDYYKAPKIIDYLSLDVEGSEERILSNFPFNKYTFLTMTIERPTPKLEKVLFDNDYVFVRKSIPRRTDSFYVHKSIPNFTNIITERHSPTPRKGDYIKWRKATPSEIKRINDREN